MNSPASVLSRLQQSAFRRRFQLGECERRYLVRKGLAAVLREADEFVARRLAPAAPAHDGRQTPWRGHPVFVAQHATATCCRKCLARWHAIPAGTDLTPCQKHYILQLIRRWLVAAAPDLPMEVTLRAKKGATGQLCLPGLSWESLQ